MTNIRRRLSVNKFNSDRHDILCVDMKSFFATCECVERGFDPLKKKLAVVGNVEKDGSVVLAASPALKKMGIKTGSRLFEIKELKDKSIFVTQARMGLYQKKADEIRGIFEEFVPENHIDIYSIDEAWLTLDGTYKLWGNSWEAAEKIRSSIYNKTGIIATVGIGDNKFLAKVVLDNYGKYFGIAECRHEDVEKLLHPLAVEEMWGVGEKMKNNLNRMKIYTIGDLAKAPEDVMKKNYGVVGVRLQRNANGLDDFSVTYENSNGLSAFGNTGPNAKSVGRGVTLWEDYKNEDDVLLVIRELIEEVCVVLRERKKLGKTIHLSVEYSRHQEEKGFSRQITLTKATSVEFVFYKSIKRLFREFYVQKKPVRKLRVSVGNLEEVTDDYDELDKQGRLNMAKDLLNERFGKGTLKNASSLQNKSISKEQVKKIRGHYE